MKMKYTLLFISCLICTTIVSQTAGQVLAKSKEILSRKNYSSDVEYRVYEKHNSTTPIQSISAQFKQLSNGYFQKIGDITIIQDGEYLLTINDTYEEISLARTSLPMKNPIDINLDDLESDNLKTNLKETNDSYEINITFHKSHLEVEKILFVIDKKTYYPKSMTFFFGSMSNNDDEKSKMEVLFTNFKTKVQPNNQEKMNHFISISKDDFSIINSKYKNYKKHVNI